YSVTGTITVSNDGDVAVTGVDVTDSLTGGTILCSNLTVPAHGAVQCPYSVSPGSAVPNNTATASWGDEESASATTAVQWADPTEVGSPASVEDDGQIDESLDVGDLTNGAWTTTYDEGWTCAKGTPSPN